MTDFTVELLLFQNGEMVKHESYPFQSFLINWVKYEYVGKSNAAVAGSVDTSGNTFTQQVAVPCVVNAPSSTTTYGIVVGSGSVAVTPSDAKLQSFIPHGTGSGQLSYGAASITTPSLSDQTIGMLISRQFTNSSGGNVIVREVGLYGWTTDTSAAAKYIAIARDVIPAFTVPTGTTFEVRYNFQVST